MRLLVTGGAGFIGSNYVRRCLGGTLKNISSVTVLDSLTYAGSLTNLADLLPDPRLNFVEGNVCDLDLVSTLVSEVDAIINFAAESHVDRSIVSASDFILTNVLGVQIQLEAILNSGGDKRFVQISTDEVYGSIEKDSWDETAPILPNSPYSASKAGGELLARSYFRTHNLDVVITRCSNNYGPNQYPEKLIPLFITNIVEGKKLPLYGDGRNVRDWLHVDDHCLAIHKVMFNGRSGEAYNIGGGRELSNREITNLVIDLMGGSQSSIEHVPDRKGHDFRYSVNWSKINVELGYEPQVSFEDGLRSTITWYLNNEPWWRSAKKL